MRGIPRPSIRLRTCNNILTAVVSMLAVYVIIAPFLPQIAWWLRYDAPVRVLPQQRVTLDPPSATDSQAKPQADRLRIPSLGMDEIIHGGGVGALSKGVWRLPHTSTPAAGSNTVLVGHRFTYAGSAVFYHLDKIRQGDRIGVYWQGKLYEYEVSGTRIVTPDEVAVEAPTKEARLTLYTCTPLWSVTHRLVIDAKLVEGDAP